MSFPFKCFLLLLSIAVAPGADKNKNEKFDPGPVDSFSARQTLSGLTIGARALETEEQARPAFGKLNPYEQGVLPVLVVMKNDGRETLSLESMKAEYQTAHGNHVDAIPAQDVKFIYGPSRPNVSPGPLPRLPGVGRKKNPLAAWEIEGRAFSAKMLPPGQSASGFFYFQVAHRPGAALFLSGIREAATRKELFYFELPLEKTGK